MSNKRNRSEFMKYEDFFKTDTMFLRIPSNGNDRYCFTEIANSNLAKTLGFDSGNGRYVLCKGGVPCSEHVFYFPTRKAAEKASGEFTEKRYIEVGVYVLKETCVKTAKQCVFDTKDMKVVLVNPYDFKVQFIVVGKFAVFYENGFILNLDTKSVVKEGMGRNKIACVFDDSVVLCNDRGNLYGIYGVDGTVVNLR